MTADDCREWRELLGSYVLGALSPDERSAVAAHLEGCAACRAEQAELAPMRDLLMLAELAAELGVPEGTIKSRVYYGLRALRNALEELGYEG